MYATTEIEGLITAAARSVLGEDAIEAGTTFKIEPFRGRDDFQVASNAAMILAGRHGIDPMELASRIAEIVDGQFVVEACQAARPGFVNIRMTPDFWQHELRKIIQEGFDYGRSEGKTTRSKINVEFVSANPTGPLHVGHCRGAVVGDILASLLRYVGNQVHREFYVNDDGGQMETLGASVSWQADLLQGIDTPKPDAVYEGDFPRETAKLWVEGYKREGDPATFAAAHAMEINRETLSAMGVSHDMYVSETLLHGMGVVQRVLDSIGKDGWIFRGTMPPNPQDPEDDQSGRERLLFRSTRVGDDQDRALDKADGSHTYLASDIGYFDFKNARGFDRMVYVLGSDHIGYAKRLEAISLAISGDGGKAVPLFCGMVKLVRDGKPVVMSKRAGTFVTAQEVIDEVGSDVLRFMLAYQRPSGEIVFDFDKVKEKTKDNPVFYVQYAHARIRSILERTGTPLPLYEREKDPTRLTGPSEIAMITRLSQWPTVVQRAAQDMEPHRVAYYLTELAAAFHAWYGEGNQTPEARIVQPDDPALQRSRIMLATGVLQVLRTGLDLMGVSAPDRLDRDE